MKQFIRIGVDLAKNSFQVHALESEDGHATTRKLSRSAMRAFFVGIKPCLVGMEACGSAHYWARELRGMGHDVRLMPPAYVKPYVQRGKSDPVDAAACCEAVSRPTMRFVPIKSEEQQAMLMAHKTRDLLIKQRTMGVNALRGHLAEFGVIAAKGIGRVEELIEKAADASLPEIAKAALSIIVGQLEALNTSIADVTRRIARAHARDPLSRLVASVPGVGALAASAITASVPEPGVFKSGRDFAAWLGVTPRQYSTGGNEKLGSITKQGNRSLRRLLVLGSISLLRVAAKSAGTLRDWFVALRARKPAKVAAVALANKLARIIWAVMTTGKAFRTHAFSRLNAKAA